MVDAGASALLRESHLLIGANLVGVDLCQSRLTENLGKRSRARSLARYRVRDFPAAPRQPAEEHLLQLRRIDIELFVWPAFEFADINPDLE